MARGWHSRHVVTVALLLMAISATFIKGADSSTAKESASAVSDQSASGKNTVSPEDSEGNPIKGANSSTANPKLPIADVDSGSSMNSLLNGTVDEGKPDNESVNTGGSNTSLQPTAGKSDKQKRREQREKEREARKERMKKWRERFPLFQVITQERSLTLSQSDHRCESDSANVTSEDDCLKLWASQQQTKEERQRIFDDLKAKAEKKRQWKASLSKKKPKTAEKRRKYRLHHKSKRLLDGMNREMERIRKEKQRKQLEIETLSEHP
ncbi:uncharacterized protein LOC143276494 isoform X2 [Babylonia areolata]|uniref:uncharacterized protein LOC143276494 isoform X2 n=1 Tax=Babylonia areolata TaxID=304850 RepID=UPI003FD0A95E